MSPLRRLNDEQARLRALRDSGLLDNPGILLRTMAEGLIVFNPQGEIRLANDAALRLLGVEHRKLIGMTAQDSRWAPVRPDGSPLPPAELPSKITARTGQSCHHVVFGLMCGDGKRRWVSASTTCIAGEGDPSRGILALFTDITALRATMLALDEPTLAEREMRMRVIFETAADAIIMIGSTGVIEQINPAAERLFGYLAADLVGQNVKILMSDPDAERHDDYLERYAATGRRSIIGVGREVVARRRDGSVFPAELAVSEYIVRGERRFTGLIRDISERKKIDRQVSEYELRLRASLAYDLHDSLGQLLAGGRFLAQNLASDLPEELEPRMTRIVELLSEALEKVRGLSNSLSALEMAGTSFTRALQVLAKKASSLYAIICTVEIPSGTPDPPPSQGNQAYMIVEEALANAARHSGCTAITIAFSLAVDRYQLTVRDDGRGISPQRSGAGLGLTTMRHRARLLGGSITVDRAGLTGTEVRLDWPAAEHSTASP